TARSTGSRCSRPIEFGGRIKSEYLVCWPCAQFRIDKNSLSLWYITRGDHRAPYRSLSPSKIFQDAEGDQQQQQPQQPECSSVTFQAKVITCADSGTSARMDDKESS